MLKKEFSEYPLPDKQNGEVTYWTKHTNAKARKELGINFIPIEQTMTEMARTLINFGLIKIQD